MQSVTNWDGIVMVTYKTVAKQSEREGDFYLGVLRLNLCQPVNPCGLSHNSLWGYFL